MTGVPKIEINLVLSFEANVDWITDTEWQVGIHLVKEVSTWTSLHFEFKTINYKTLSDWNFNTLHRKLIIENNWPISCNQNENKKNELWIIAFILTLCVKTGFSCFSSLQNGNCIPNKNDKCAWIFWSGYFFRDPFSIWISMNLTSFIFQALD